MPLVENIVWLLVVITVIGSAILIIGKMQGSLNVVSAGKTTSCIGILGLVITLIIYLKIRKLEVEEKQVDALDRFLTK